LLSVLLPIACWTGCAGIQAESKQEPDSRKTAVGSFTLLDLKGQRVNLQDFDDKVVLLSFWATWCEPCRVELPALQEIWDRYRRSGFELITINVDPPDTESTVRQFVRRYRYRFPVLLDQETVVANRFNPTMDLPFSVLINRKGRIEAVHQGYKIGDEAAIEQMIHGLLAR
jgi:peroxiredoxin